MANNIAVFVNYYFLNLVTPSMVLQQQYDDVIISVKLIRLWNSAKMIHHNYLYYIILLISVGVRKLQVAILARSSREMSLTVRIV